MGMFLLLTGLLGLLAPARAEEDDPGAASELLVVEAAAHRPGEQVVEAERVQREGARSVAEALDLEPSVTLHGNLRGERVFSLRGFSPRQVAVFVDGVPASVPYGGEQDLGKLPSAFVERVRVLPPAVPGLYGPESLGGVVLVEGRAPPAAPGAGSSTGVAAHGAVEAFSWAGGPAGRRLHLLAAAGGRSSPGDPLSARFEPCEREDGGLRDASARRSLDGHLQARLELPRGGHLDAGLDAFDGAYDVPTALEGSARYWRFDPYRDLGVSLRHAGPPGGRLREREAAWFALDENTLDAYDDATRTTQEAEGAFHSTYRDRRWGGSAELRLDAGPARLAGWLFADQQEHRGQSDRGEPWTRVSRSLLSAALGGELRGEELRAYAGAELDGELSADFSPAAPFLGPSLGLAWEPGPAWELALGVARRSRAPTLKERFSEGMTGREPNPDLLPERAWHGEADADWHPGGELSLRLGAWGSLATGLIEEVPTGDGDTRLENAGRTLLYGTELRLRALPGPLDLSLGAALLRGRRLEDDDGHPGVPELPAWKLRGEARWLTGRASPFLGMEALGPQDYQDPDTLEWGRLGACALLDAGVEAYPLPGALVRFRVENLLDADVQFRYGYPEPGRELWLEAGAEL